MITVSLREVVSLLVFLLLLLSVYGLEALLVTGYVWDRIQRRSGKSKLFARRYIVLHAAAAVGIVCTLYGHFIEPNRIEVNAMTIHTPKLKTAGFRIVQISDLHCDWKIRNEEKMVRIINDLAPDIVVATGDYLNHTLGLPHLRDSLKRLEAPLGKFAVMGNVDAHYAAHLNLLDGTGFRRLDWEEAVVTKDADSIGIWGMDFGRFYVSIDPLKALPKDRFNIFLFHTPDLIEDVSGSGVDLYLCGHTHGGQVCLPWYGALITFSRFGKKYESGLYRVGETTLYVNRGLGLEPRPAPQVRFLARPEIAVFDILPERQ
jgi:predicted MPP superfamily phosphohydrolase